MSTRKPPPDMRRQHALDREALRLAANTGITFEAAYRIMLDSICIRCKAEPVRVGGSIYCARCWQEQVNSAMAENGLTVPASPSPWEVAPECLNPETRSPAALEREESASGETGETVNLHTTPRSTAGW